MNRVLVNLGTMSLASRSITRVVGLHTSASRQLKKIDIVQDEKKKTITVEGRYLDSEKEFGNRVLKLDERTDEASASSSSTSHTSRPCPFCSLEKRGIFVQYSDVLVLRQFLTQDGVPLPLSVTGLCRKQHKKLHVMTKQAKQAGLILNLQPRLLDESMRDTDIRKRPRHLKWNTYFDDYEVMRRKNKYL